ncbi:MAG: hypothetical protein HY821_19155 [Acidobacteria bacterium]|nr:hypothetical protein [Acidobacteriota bacterium]
MTTNLDWIGKREADLVLTAGEAPAGLEAFVSRGGKVLAISATPPAFGAPPATLRQPSVKGYLRVRNPARFPSLKRSPLLMLDGPFSSAPDDPNAALTLVPPSMFGPPEFIHTDMRDTSTPAVLSMRGGGLTWVPFDLGALYYQHSLTSHAALLQDLINPLLPKRQLLTDAHPLVEVSLMEQDGRTLLHLINLSGHSQTAYFPPVPMQSIELDLDGGFTTARAVRANQNLQLRPRGGRTMFTLPRLLDYELIVLTKTAPSGVRK